MNIDVESINKLDEFVFALGLSSVSLKTAHTLQSKALSLDFLETDERELVESIKYQIGRSLVAISDLMRLMDQRAIINVNDVGARLQAKCQESLQKLQAAQ